MAATRRSTVSGVKAPSWVNAPNEVAARASIPGDPGNTPGAVKTPALLATVSTAVSGDAHRPERTSKPDWAWATVRAWAKIAAVNSCDFTSTKSPSKPDRGAWNPGRTTKWYLAIRMRRTDSSMRSRNSRSDFATANKWAEALGKSSVNSRTSFPARRAFSSSGPVGAPSAAPRMFKASVKTRPWKPISSRKTPEMTFLDSDDEIPAGSSAGTFKWATITLPAWGNSALNGLSSTESNAARLRSTVGKVLWESESVSPCPGKCLAQSNTPASCMPRR